MYLSNVDKKLFDVQSIFLQKCRMMDSV